MYSNESVQFIHSRPTDLHFSSVQFSLQTNVDTPLEYVFRKKNEAQLPSPLAETPGLGFASSDQLADTSVSAWKPRIHQWVATMQWGPMAILLVSDGRFD